MENPGNIILTHVEGNDEHLPIPIGGEHYPLFQGVEIADPTQAHVYDTQMGMFDSGSEKREPLFLQEDMYAENPADSQQVSVQPDPMETGNENEVVPVGLVELGQQPQTSPLKPGESISATAKGHIRRASQSMKEGVKQATVGVAYAGEKVGKAWDKTLESAMWVCVVSGLLAIIFLILGTCMLSWRYQELTYNDSNGSNTSLVQLGLSKMQRIQTLERAEKAGTVYIYDDPVSYKDAMSSAYCVPDQTSTAAVSEETSSTDTATAPPPPPQMTWEQVK